MYWIAQANERISLKIYRERFRIRNLPDLQTFECFHWELFASGSIYDLRYDTGTERYRRVIHAVKEAILCTVENSISRSSRAVGRVFGISSTHLPLRSLYM